MKMQMSTYERIFHLTLYGKLIMVVYVILLPSQLPLTSPLVFIQEEISGWREDLFTARKSAINLIGVMSVSKVALLWSLVNYFYTCIPNSIFFQLVFYAYRDLWQELLLIAYQHHQNVKRLKGPREAINILQLENYWCFRFCRSFQFLLMLIHPKLEFRTSEHINISLYKLSDIELVCPVQLYIYICGVQHLIIFLCQ